ncbi:hypothetical protein GO730_31800 [Spirosoma sp. HMF3257]|uniref:Uncharacterized protein n=1 Tax=Spirosoma telluris TaxID=2183553 RepID=A0A327NQ82_9BACT|nr:hypothetical protein [Spirosoma telluris]RAI77581.1 hypothetical protein HMF3257_31690 [Spirosoma telluris]
MKTATEKKTALPNKLVVTENPELDRIFGNRVFFPQKNKQAEEQIRKHGMPKELAKEKATD